MSKTNIAHTYTFLNITFHYNKIRKNVYAYKTILLLIKKCNNS